MAVTDAETRALTAIQIGAIQERITSGGLIPVTVTGRSMIPTLRDRRDGVTLGPIEMWPPRRGEILFCRRDDGSPVMHRVIRIVGNGVILNGDGQVWMEGPIRRDMAIARVVMMRRGKRYVRVDRLLPRMWAVMWMAARPVRKRVFLLFRWVKRLISKKHY